MRGKGIRAQLLSLMLILTLSLGMLPGRVSAAEAEQKAGYSYAAQEDRSGHSEVTPLDYGDPVNWAYFSLGKDTGIDVFLICPTVDTRSERNSFDLNDKLKGRFLNALDMEKGIYAEAGRLYSPYYRQMSMNAYKLSPEEQAEAQKIAYGDISAAFRRYLDRENGGRGIILAGFSQGAQMCLS